MGGGEGTEQVFVEGAGFGVEERGGLREAVEHEDAEGGGGWRGDGGGGGGHFAGREGEGGVLYVWVVGD